jgi:hypothetical protein
MVSGRTFSPHARQRMRQRAMNERDIDVILAFGTAVDGDAVLLTEKDVTRATEILARVHFLSVKGWARGRYENMQVGAPRGPAIQRVPVYRVGRHLCSRVEPQGSRQGSGDRPIIATPLPFYKRQRYCTSGHGHYLV